MTLITLLAVVGIGGFVRQTSPESPSAPVERVEALVEITAPTVKITKPLPWPEYGQAAYAIANTGAIASSDDGAKPIPIASLAKVITALAVLKKEPLALGEQGPMITLTEQDVALYNNYLSKNGAVALVEAGEQISQYQAIQGMLLPSANNIADSLVVWAFGSVEEYNVYANKMMDDLGLLNVTVADASGFSPSTVGTAEDMAQLGILYMQNPVLRQIAMQTEANIPVAGLIPNYNSVINQDGLFGIKVGYTDEAGRCFMLANVTPNGSSKNDISVTVVLGADHLNTAMQDAKTIIAAGDN